MLSFREDVNTTADTRCCTEAYIASWQDDYLYHDPAWQSDQAFFAVAATICIDWIGQ